MWFPFIIVAVVLIILRIVRPRHSEVGKTKSNLYWFYGLLLGGLIWFLLAFIGMFIGQGGCPIGPTFCYLENIFLSPLSVVLGREYNTELNLFLLNGLVYACFGLVIGIIYGTMKRNTVSAPQNFPPTQSY